MKSFLRVAAGAAVVVALCAPAVTAAQTSSSGQTGLVHMPDGRVGPDGTFRAGASRMEPYTAGWANIAILPWLEVSGRYTRTDNVLVFTEEEGFSGEFGNHRDKAFDFKVRLFDETDTLPSVSFGVQDFHGTGLFPGQYIAASKLYETDAYGSFDFTLGFGRKRFDGAFGGVRWTTPWDDRFRVVLEWDAYDYTDDFYARSTGDVRRKGGLTAGIEFASGLWAGQFAAQDGELGLNLSLMLPLQQPTFVAKSAEPPPVAVELAQRPPLDEWTESPEALAPLYHALAEEQFRDIQVRITGTHVDAKASVGRMTMIGRAAGRVARLIALHAPADVQTLDLTMSEGRTPLATYRFADVPLLRAFFEGNAPPDALQATLSVAYTDARAWNELLDVGHDWGDVIGAEHTGRIEVQRSALSLFGAFNVYRDQEDTGVVRFQPLRAGFLFNDPNGALRYDLYSTIGYSQWLNDDGLYFVANGRITLVENISNAHAFSNSLLPRVRSEAHRYRQESGRVSLSSMYVGHVGNPFDRIHTSFSAGYLEMMFAGIGGEVLYLPETGNWAADVRAYAVRQRDFKGWLGFQDYETVTALASFYYRVPKYGLTFTTRAGRFLAGDHGARFEAKRRFRSGFEAGAWYTYTDAKDITSPGTPESPYQDKGVFVRIALGPILPYDSASAASIAINAWQRDPGQMLAAPGNLYDLHERRLLLNIRDYGPWTDFGL